MNYLNYTSELPTEPGFYWVKIPEQPGIKMLWWDGACGMLMNPHRQQFNKIDNAVIREGVEKYKWELSPAITVEDLKHALVVVDAIVEEDQYITEPEEKCTQGCLLVAGANFGAMRSAIKENGEVSEHPARINKLSRVLHPLTHPKEYGNQPNTTN